MQFGSYQTVRELGAGPSGTVYLASAEGRHKGQPRFAVKACTAGGANLLDAWHGGDAAEAAAHRVADFSAATTKQKRACAASRHIAPIHDGGQTDTGAWFATDYYPRSAQRLIEGMVALPVAAIHHLIASVVRGALDFKSNAGEGHGNLKPSNVLIARESNLAQARVVLSDPAPPGKADASAIEVADLRGIGELLYQLVRRRQASGADNWPIAQGNEWTTAFGDAAPKWLELCNRLLDPNLSLNKTTLESVQAELAALKPKGSTAVVAIGLAIAAVVVIGLGLWMFLPRKQAVSVEIVSSPAGALVFDPADPSKPLGPEPYAFTAKPGAQRAFKLTLDGYEPLTTNLVVTKSVFGPTRVTFALVPRTSGDDTVFFAAREFKLAVAKAKEKMDQASYLAARAIIADAEKAYPADADARLQCVEDRKRLDGLTAMVKQKLDAELAAVLKEARDAMARGDNQGAAAKAEAVLAIEKESAEAKDLLDKASRQLNAQQQYRLALDTAQKAIANGDFTTAVVKADEALKSKPADAEATKVLNSARSELSYREAMDQARIAFDKKDFKTAIAKATEASGLKRDPAALKLRDQAQRDLDFDTFFAEGAAALKANGYDVAIGKFEKAVKLRDTPEVQKLLAAAKAMRDADVEFKNELQGAIDASKKGDWAVVKARASRALQLNKDSKEASNLLAAAKLEDDFRTALQTAKNALDRKEYRAALTNAQSALALKSGSVEAQDIIARARPEIEYEAAFVAARTAMERGDYQNAQARASEALRIRPGDPASTALIKEARSEVGYRSKLDQATAAFKAQEFGRARDFAGEALVAKQGGKEADAMKRAAQAELDYSGANTFYTALNYDDAVKLCANYTDERFVSLKKRVEDESRTYTQIKTKFEAGTDYAFINDPAVLVYKDRLPFKEVLDKAVVDLNYLSDLRELTNRVDWPGATKKWGQVPAETQKKAVFQTINVWLDQHDPALQVERELIRCAVPILGPEKVNSILRRHDISGLKAPAGTPFDDRQVTKLRKQLESQQALTPERKELVERTLSAIRAGAF